MKKINKTITERRVREEPISAPSDPFIIALCYNLLDKERSNAAIFTINPNDDTLLHMQQAATLRNNKFIFIFKKTSLKISKKIKHNKF